MTEKFTEQKLVQAVKAVGGSPMGGMYYRKRADRKRPRS